MTINRENGDFIILFVAFIFLGYRSKKMLAYDVTRAALAFEAYFPDDRTRDDANAHMIMANS